MPSDPIITVEGLGKRYRLGAKSGERYTALRDVVAEAASRPFRSLSRKFKSKNGASDPAFNLNSSTSTRTSNDEEFWALKNVSFEVRQGEVLGIIGRNGAGKSTLLKILSRITEPTEGRITIKGRVASLLEVGTGFHPELTGRENIFLNGAILGMHRHEIKSKFDEIVAFAEVEKFLDTPVKRYSSGMYVRLAFAVAAHLEPEILIVDEVLAVGDAEFQKKCLGKMGDVARTGRTVLFVSHQMGAVAALCEIGMLLNCGQIASRGAVRDVVRDYLSLSNDAISHYTINPNDLDHARNQIVSVQTESDKGISSIEFSYSEHICLTIKLQLSHVVPSLLLGVGLDNSMQTRVLTVFREASEVTEIGPGGHHIARLQLPERIIAPSRYSFTLAIFEHRGAIHDHVLNICPIQILDDGSPHARFEGLDYGNVIVDAQWIT